MRTQRCVCLVLVYLVFMVFAGLLVSAEAEGAEFIMDTTAREWMAWDKGSRTVWLNGYVSGVTYIVQLFGADLRSSGTWVFTVSEMEEMVYRELLMSPELRSGTITNVAMAVISRRLVLTHRLGYRIPLEPAQR